MALEATATQQAIGADLPRRARTRQGKARLLTLNHLDRRTAASRRAAALAEAFAAEARFGEPLTAAQRTPGRPPIIVGAGKISSSLPVNLTKIPKIIVQKFSAKIFA
jgi:hypothetical protein